MLNQLELARRLPAIDATLDSRFRIGDAFAICYSHAFNALGGGRDMTDHIRTGYSRTQARRRFLHRLTLLAGGALFAPLFARATATPPATIPATPKAGRLIVFPDFDASALGTHVSALGYKWTPVANQAAAHASAAGDEAVAVIGTGAGVSAALRFARSHSNVKAVLVMGADHGDALDEFHALQASRAYAVQVLGKVDAVDWQGAGRWLDRHMA